MESSRLAGVPVFAGLPEHELAAIAAAASEVDVGEGETIATEGDFGHAMFANREWDCGGSAGRETAPNARGGRRLGEIAAIASGRRTASVVATSPLRLIAFFKRDLWALERDAPEATERLRALIEERRAADEA